jgi:hypothetical protein
MPLFDRSASGIIDIDPQIEAGAMPTDDSTLDRLLASFAHRETLEWSEDLAEPPPAPRYAVALTVRPVTLRADLVQLAADLEREHAGLASREPA